MSKTKRIDKRTEPGVQAQSLDPLVGVDVVIDLTSPEPSRRSVAERHLDDARRAPLGPAGPWPEVPLRLMDICGSVMALVIVSPLMLMVAAAVRLSGPGPTLFRQRRIGRSGVAFTCFKFRTMHQNSAKSLEELLQKPELLAEWQSTRKLQDDPRSTSVGRFLRRWDLDELPQLWNVLIGDMSLVGPRPVPAEESELYGRQLRLVLSVRPGMTGLWQVSGRNSLSYRRRVEIDVDYVCRRSVITNVRIVARTLRLIATRQSGVV